MKARPDRPVVDVTVYRRRPLQGMSGCFIPPRLDADLNHPP